MLGDCYGEVGCFVGVVVQVDVVVELYDCDVVGLVVGQGFCDCVQCLFLVDVECLGYGLQSGQEVCGGLGDLFKSFVIVFWCWDYYGVCEIEVFDQFVFEIELVGVWVYDFDVDDVVFVCLCQQLIDFLVGDFEEFVDFVLCFVFVVVQFGDMYYEQVFFYGFFFFFLGQVGICVCVFECLYVQRMFVGLYICGDVEWVFVMLMGVCLC